MTGRPICQHQRDVEMITRISLSRVRPSTASVVSSKMLADETMAACKAACGDVSPYRDVELHPIPHGEAVSLIQRSNAGAIDILLEEFADVARAVRAGVRRLARRLAASRR
jgi:hypothetical protein